MASIAAPAQTTETKVPFWTLTLDAQFAALGSGRQGLSQAAAAKRLASCGPNADAVQTNRSALRSILKRLLEPLSLILLAAGIVSAATGDAIGGSIIVVILAVSIGLDTVQEGHAVRAAEILRHSVALKANVLRDGQFVQVGVESVVPGDVLRVTASDIIAADALVIESSAFTANEAALTGEPYPVEKHVGLVAAKTAAEASNALFRGAIAQTGQVTALVVGTGAGTLFGSAAAALNQPTELSPFQRDLRAYGLLISTDELAGSCRGTNASPCSHPGRHRAELDDGEKRRADDQRNTSLFLPRFWQAQTPRIRGCATAPPRAGCPSAATRSLERLWAFPITQRTRCVMGAERSLDLNLSHDRPIGEDSNATPSLFATNCQRRWREADRDPPWLDRPPWRPRKDCHQAL